VGLPGKFLDILVFEDGIVRLLRVVMNRNFHVFHYLCEVVGLFLGLECPVA
jgi:hypothetical protein